MTIQTFPLTTLMRESCRMLLCQARRQRLCRSFFASSTDHTRLLADAQVHRLEIDADTLQYVLVASGTDIDLVQKVPQLHLARLFLSRGSGDADGDNNMGATMYGAKVINRTLGEPAHVCDKLVEAARNDGASQAKSTLHGLSDFVVQTVTDTTTTMTTTESQRILAIANGSKLEESYGDDNVKEQWEQLAKDYVSSGKCAEANLYQDKGAILSKILHFEDKSVFADTCGRSMALFHF